MQAYPGILLMKDDLHLVIWLWQDDLGDKWCKAKVLDIARYPTVLYV